MPTILDGAGVDTGSGSYGVNSAVRVVDMKDKIYLLEPSSNPLTLLLGKMGKASAKNPKFEWVEDEAMPILDTVNGTFTTTTLTTFLVDNGTYFTTNVTIKNTRSGEIMLVTGVSTDTLSVTRNLWGTAPAAINDADELIILGGMAAENADAMNPREVKKANAYNYTEIVRTVFGVSRTLNESETYGGNTLAYLQKARGIDHAKSLELKLLWGERAEKDNTSSIVRSTGGMWQVISTNSTDYSNTMTAALIEGASAEDFRYGSSSKMLFGSRAVVGGIAALGLSSIQIAPQDKTFGLNITKWITTNGVYNIIAHDLFITDTYDEVAMILDLDALAYRYLRNSDTKLRTNIQTPSKDGRIDEYLTEMGLERKEEKKHSKWTSCLP